MVAGILLYAPRRSTIFEAHEQEGVAGMSTVALRSSSGSTMIDTHVLNRGPAGVQSPADRMFR